ncbi:MAG: acyltransferase [Actinoplanes sp.]
MDHDATTRAPATARNLDLPLRLPALTGLRFVLSLAVLLGHATYVLTVFDGPPQLIHGLTELLATAAVSGFFVLSGFILTWTHRPGDRPRRFWRRRFWKIFPNHAIAWLACVLFFVVAAGAPSALELPGHRAGGGILGFFLLQSWIPDVTIFTGFNTPAWSISTEAFFYALFPLLIVGALRIAPGRLRGVFAAVGLTVLALPLVAMAVDGPPPPASFDWLRMNEYSFWFVYVFPPVRVLEFVLGIVAARLMMTGGELRVPLRWAWTLLALALLVTPVLPPQYTFGAVCAIPFALVITGLADRDRRGRPGTLTRPAMVLLGEASYALYISHFPILLAGWQLCQGRLDTPWLTAVFGAVFMVVAVGVSVLMYRYFESPLMRRFAGPRQRIIERA